MKRLRAIIILLLVVSNPLPVFASAFSTPQCPMMEMSADTPMTMDVGSTSDDAMPDCCDCSDDGNCNAPCISVVAYVQNTFPQQNASDFGTTGFADLQAAIFPSPPSRLLRPPQSL